MRPENSEDLRKIDRPPGRQRLNDRRDREPLGKLHSRKIGRENVGDRSNVLRSFNRRRRVLLFGHLRFFHFSPCRAPERIVSRIIFAIS